MSNCSPASHYNLNMTLKFTKEHDDQIPMFLHIHSSHDPHPLFEVSSLALCESGHLAERCKAVHVSYDHTQTAQSETRQSHRDDVGTKVNGRKERTIGIEHVCRWPVSHLVVMVLSGKVGPKMGYK